MQGLVTGPFVSDSMSIINRAYSPSIHTKRVFSAMAATVRFGFSLGTLQGGELNAHLEWIFRTNTIICALLCIATYFSIPKLQLEVDVAGTETPTLRNYIVGGFAAGGCLCLLFGLTQDPSRLGLHTQMFSSFLDCFFWLDFSLVKRQLSTL